MKTAKTIEIIRLIEEHGICFCKDCEKTKSITEFSKQTKHPTGYMPYCKECCYKRYGEKQRIRSLKYHKTHKDNLYYREYRKKYKKLHPRKNRNLSINSKICMSMRKRIKKTLKSHTIIYKDIIGCSGSQLKQYIESKFTNNMSWDNYGKLWEIDHIIPCAAFTSDNKQHLFWCWNYRNLQPLSKEENNTKSDKLPSGLNACKHREDKNHAIHQEIGLMLERLEITTHKEYIDSLKNVIQVNYLSI